MKKYTSKTNFDYDKIDSDVLEWFPYEYEGERIILRTYSDEFTCTCPWSSLPDFATVTVAYEPHKRCVELKSFKIYIVSYRDVGIFHEHAVNRIFDDLAKLLKPNYLRVRMDYKNRGGFITSSEKERKFKNE